MILAVYCIFDRKTVQFSNPHFLINEGHAIRSFTDEINRVADDNPLHKHFGDFDLYHLGSYNGETGLFATGVPRMVVTGESVKV